MSLVSPSSPSRLGRYEIIGLLATGGMAEVHLGRIMGPSGFERVVVVKRILPHLAREGDFVDMFLDEARIVAKINHPNVIQVSELGRDGDELFLVMEFVEGESLGGFMRRHWANDREIGAELAAFVVSEICAGLHAAHELKDEEGRPQKIVHRDVSPQNVMITYSGQVKVLDFGIAQAVDRSTRTATGQLKGKVEYMSPEQCRAMPLDRRSDVFSLGVLLFELSTGKRLFRRRGELESLLAVNEAPIPPPSSIVEGYPKALEAVVMRALSRPVEGRFATADEMRRAILAFLRTTADVGLHDEALGARMRDLFGDRLELKNAMLRSVRAGSSVTRLPPPEVDLNVEVPTVPAIAKSVVAEVSSIDGSKAQGTPRRSRRVVGVLAFLTAGAGAGAFAWAAMGRSSSEGVATSAEATAAASSATAASEAPTVVAATSSSVQIEIVTNPSGARVSIGSADHGATPVTLTVPRSEDPLDVELRLDDHQSMTERVVPKVDQRISLKLSPSPRYAPVRKTTPSASAAPSGKYRKFN